MGADFDVEWTRDLGDGRLLVMQRVSAGYRALLVGFRGVGLTQQAALDDLLSRMEDYGTASENLARSLAPGGQLHAKMQEIEQIVNQIARGQS